MFHLHYVTIFNKNVQGVPKKNVPLGEGQTSPKGTFFWGHLVHKECTF